jgi:hypothetical protein
MPAPMHNQPGGRLKVSSEFGRSLYGCKCVPSNSSNAFSAISDLRRIFLSAHRRLLGPGCPAVRVTQCGLKHLLCQTEKVLSRKGLCATWESKVTILGGVFCLNQELGCNFCVRFLICFFCLSQRARHPLLVSPVAQKKTNSIPLDSFLKHLPFLALQI